MARSVTRFLVNCLVALGCQIIATLAAADHVATNAIVAPGATLTRIADGYAFTEGPIADAGGNVFFTDQPNNRILQWRTDGTVNTYLEPAGRANGLYIDNSGNLIACADEENHLWKISPDKKVSSLVTDFAGKRLNGPNDLWVSPEGGIYFTDPYYQREYWQHAAPAIDRENVYFLSPENQLTVVSSDLIKPNGIIGSANGSELYIADIGADKTYKYAILADGRLVDKQLFFAMGSDGLTLDNRDNLYLTGNGVTVINPAGEKILHIAVDQPWTSNVTFGGKDGTLLFITASDSIYSLKMNVKGAHRQ